MGLAGSPGNGLGNCYDELMPWSFEYHEGELGVEYIRGSKGFFFPVENLQVQCYYPCGHIFIP